MKNKKSKDAKKSKETEKQQLRNISSNKILIRVFKDFGSNTAILKAEYEAVERRDAYNNLISINREFLHDEDTDFRIDDVYHNMQVLLEFKSKKIEDKINIVDKKIIHQEKLIKFIDKYPDLNAKYNYADENLKLHDYRLLKENTANITGQGAYFTIENGKRVYSFDSVDGFLVPLWRGVSTHSQYPDHTRKKKIVIQEDIILQQELQKYNINKKLGNLLVWGMIVISILFALNVWSGLKLLEMHGEVEDRAHDSALKCVEYTAGINKLFADAMANKLFSPEQEENIKSTITELKPDELS